MASDTTSRPLGEVRVGISGELLDALVEAMVLPPDPRARSAVICTVVQQMCSTVTCLQASETGQGRATAQELTSMRQLARAAYDHRLRMTFVTGASGTETS
jgi:hypothetical protein